MKIIQSFLTQNPCYKSGKTITVKGLMLHSVGCPQPSATVFVKRWNSSSYTRACVHGFIDANNGYVYQTLPWNRRGWHCGSGSKGSGNNTHIGVEMCESSYIKYTSGSKFTITNVEKAKADAKRAYNTAVELFAYLCKQYKLDPLKDGVIISHNEGHSRGIASNHGDPEHYWKGVGLSYTMNGFRKDVKSKMPSASATTSTPTTKTTIEKNPTGSIDYNKAMSWWEKICEDSNVKYSQSYRNGKKDKNGHVCYDCSSFVFWGLKQAGFKLGNSAFTTRTMESVLKSLGFKQRTGTTAKRGDILWKSGHTEVCWKDSPISKSYAMGAHGEYYHGGSKSGKARPLKDQVSISDSAQGFTKAYYYPNAFVTKYVETPKTEKETTNVKKVEEPAQVTDKGTIRLEVIAAICGNFWQESRLNPSAYQGKGNVVATSKNLGYGLGQWTNTKSTSRLKLLLAYLDKRGSRINGNYQLDYAFDAETNNENKSKVKYWNTTRAKKYNCTTKQEYFNNKKLTLEELTNCWLEAWEGGQVSLSGKKRLGFAQTMLKYLQEHQAEISKAKWKSSGKENSLCVARWFLDNGFKFDTSEEYIESTEIEDEEAKKDSTQNSSVGTEESTNKPTAITDNTSTMNNVSTDSFAVDKIEVDTQAETESVNLFVKVRNQTIYKSSSNNSKVLGFIEIGVLEIAEIVGNFGKISTMDGWIMVDNPNTCTIQEVRNEE